MGQKLKLMPPPLRKSKAPSGRRKKRKVRAKKTLTKKPKEKREKKRKMVRAKKKRKEMTKFLFLLSPNLVISYYIYQIRHLIIISALLTKKKGARRDRLRQFEIYPNPTVRKTPKKIPIQRAKCQTNPPSKKNDRTSR